MIRVLSDTVLLESYQIIRVLSDYGVLTLFEENCSIASGVWTVTPLCFLSSQLERIYSCLMLSDSALDPFTFFNLILLKDN